METKSGLYRNTKTGKVLRLQAPPAMGQNSPWEKVEPEEVGVAASAVVQEANDELSAGADDAEEDSGAN